MQPSTVALSCIHRALVVSATALALCEAAPTELRFIPATPENTTLVDGSPVNPKDGEGAWKWLPNEGNHGIFESYGDPKKNAPTLLIMAKDLETGRDCEVFGFFWSYGVLQKDSDFRAGLVASKRLLG